MICLRAWKCLTLNKTRPHYLCKTFVTFLNL